MFGARARCKGSRLPRFLRCFAAVYLKSKPINQPPYQPAQPSQPPATSQPSPTSHQPPASQPPATSHPPPATSHQPRGGSVSGVSFCRKEMAEKRGVWARIPLGPKTLFFYAENLPRPKCGKTRCFHSKNVIKLHARARKPCKIRGPVRGSKNTVARNPVFYSVCGILC